MKISLIIILFLFGLLSATLLRQARREKPPPGRSKAGMKPRTGGAAFPHPGTDTPDSPPFGGSQIDDLRAGLNKKIHDPVERIFSGEGDAIGSGSLPLGYDNVQKQIKDEVMEEIKGLKNFHGTHRRLQKIIADPALQIGSELAKMVTADPVLTAKILNTVNSPYYGLRQKVDSIGHALLLLGIVQLREILYRNGLLKLFRTEDPVRNELMETLWRHATLTSICASHLHSLYRDLDRGTLFTMGLLHDIGKLILLKWVGAERYPQGVAIGEEEALFGINHAIIGRMALKSWGFSDLMVSVIEQHHAPSLRDANGLDLDRQKKQYLIVLFFADQLAKLALAGQEKVEIISFLPSYLPLIDLRRFIDAGLDDVLFSAIRQSEAFAEPAQDF